MRRGRIITGAIALLAAASLAQGASAATPQDICADLADNGRLDAQYSIADLQAYNQNPGTIVQGYGAFVCTPVPIVTVTVPPTTVTTPPTTVTTPPTTVTTPPTTVTTPTTPPVTPPVTTTIPAPPPPAVTPVTPPVEQPVVVTVTPPTPQSGVAGESKTIRAEVCRNSAGQPLDINGHVVTNIRNAAPLGAGCREATPSSGVLGAEVCRNSAGQPLNANGQVVSSVSNAAPIGSGCHHVAQVCRDSAGRPLDSKGNVVSNIKNAAPAGTQCRHSGVAGVQATIAPTKASGTLPFTGAELGVFAIVGLLLIATGIVLRMTGRKSSDS